MKSTRDLHFVSVLRRISSLDVMCKAGKFLVHSGEVIGC